MELSKKVAYLKGLMEGLKIDDSTNEGKILAMMADVLEDMAEAVEDLAVEADETIDLVDALDEDLGALEEDFYGLDDDEEDDDECDCCCDDDEMYECICPSCGDKIMLDENIIADGSMECPGCGEKLEFDFDEEEND
ncbi:MAG: hypothetical protein IKH90_00225 [Ruminococcus sp.]|nr:hypothetical protein [Ruminococcus sp.]